MSEQEKVIYAQKTGRKAAGYKAHLTRIINKINKKISVNNEDEIRLLQKEVDEVREAIVDNIYLHVGLLSETGRFEEANEKEKEVPKKLSYVGG